MIVYIVALIIIFVLFVVLLFTLRLNKNQLGRLVYYQYNYIPEPLISLVKVNNLKPII
ncbi:ac110 [Hemileuca sp. nucleopolyhedrovirus]|uniref:Ac110 n=1 Tax=Hemileuca sp. nucleopolyhedrovirus TaxID=1367203 RepID=S5N3A2_9ABAC|nr:ac110 [Hemileuca sp. nucleopolyhedrovirus]AGR56845.1 ac110 [Hemileuca sp. nucleopolyhedrovirus]